MGYRLQCVGCGWDTAVDEHTVLCPRCGRDAFLRTVYDAPLELRGAEEEFSSYAAWLPFEPVLPLGGLTIGCVRAASLGAELGLSSLWLLVSAWAPELGASLPACTFKTLEAAGVMMRVMSQTTRTLIVSSAGNAGAAVVEFGARHGVPAVVVVPEAARDAMLSSREPGPGAPLLVCLRRATYPDAIRLVGLVQERFADALVREGGAYNVARRDAMGVPVLRAARAIGAIPDHYVQAVGSGTGGIAAHEAVLRLTSSGALPARTMRLHLVQNAPFTPMVDAWRRGAAEVEPMDPGQVYDRLQRTYSKVLANASPPWGVAGGVRDALLATGGHMVAVENDEARAASASIERHHGFAPSPEAGVALAGLVRQVAGGLVGRDEVVLVHATGGGMERCTADLGRRPYPVGLTIDPGDVDAACAGVGAYLDGLAGGPS